MNIAHAPVRSTESGLARLRSYIEENDFAPGDRLPAERKLIPALGVSRTELRKALDRLERDGVIWRHVGKGTFIAEPESSLDLAMSAIALGRKLTPMRMMRARICFEPALAREAALNASGAALHRMEEVIAQSEAATSWEEYERNDDLFHEAIAGASDNLLLQVLFEKMNQVRRAVAWGNVRRETPHPAADHDSFARHRRILTAISDHDPDAAQEAMRAHLNDVSRRLFGG
ncbi:FadR/GntR family transcriptional regulator [Loktanella sp. DJP18]|uniref:FadR/GntR family transcriptional regulator n=1 Tax=Loktanella sp. DJP18 TaxID=3409788 RepID=UPI003BB77179